MHKDNTSISDKKRRARPEESDGGLTTGRIDELLDGPTGTPWADRIRYRARFMYKGWEVEDTIGRVNESGVITRSHYGYEVLNTPVLGFVDCDFFKYVDGCPVEIQHLEIISQLHAWVAVHPGQSFRCYRTAAGIRIMRIDAPMPLDDEFNALCVAVGADDLYRELCINEQKCFRARLTPKPVRIGLTFPGWDPYGWNSAQGFRGFAYSDPDGTRFAAALKDYKVASEKFATCEFIETVGSGLISNDLRPLVEYHDNRCKVGSVLPMELLASTEMDGPNWTDLLQFNEKYRPTAMADDLIWNILSAETRGYLRELDDSGFSKRVRDEEAQAARLLEKWASNEMTRSRLFVHGSGEHAPWNELTADDSDPCGDPLPADSPDSDDFFERLLMLSQREEA
jgi:hypothetical protein